MLFWIRIWVGTSKSCPKITRGRNETASLTFGGKYALNIYYNVTSNLLFYDRNEPKEITKALGEITSAYFGNERKLTTRQTF